MGRVNHHGYDLPDANERPDVPADLTRLVDGGPIPRFNSVAAAQAAWPAPPSGALIVANTQVGGTTGAAGEAVDARTVPILHEFADGAWQPVLSSAQLRVTRPAGNTWKHAAVRIEGSTGAGRMWPNLALVLHGAGGAVIHFETDGRLHVRDANTVPSHRGIVASHFAVASAPDAKTSIADATPGTTALPADLGGQTWDPVARIKTLRPKTFKREVTQLDVDPTRAATTTTEPTELGLLATDVKTAAPELIHDEPGDAGHGIPAASSIDLMAVCTELLGAVQQLTARIEALEAKVP